MNIFEKIVVLGDAQLTEPTKMGLQAYSQTTITYPTHTIPDEADQISTARDADAIIVPWHTPITQTLLESCKKLKYIGATSTTLRGINLEAATQKGIIVTNVSRYGDSFVAKFIFSRLTKLLPSFKHKTLGVVGPGAVGREVVAAALKHQIQVQYYGPTRKPKMEARGITYMALTDLLAMSDVVSLHTPHDIPILGEREFKHLRPGSILVDTAVGNTINHEAFMEWISNPDNRAMFDLSIGKEKFKIYHKLPNVTAVPVVAGFTPESNEIRCKKILENIEHYLKN